MDILHALDSLGASCLPLSQKKKCKIPHIFPKHQFPNIHYLKIYINSVDQLKILSITSDTKLTLNHHCINLESNVLSTHVYKPS